MMLPFWGVTALLHLFKGYGTKWHNLTSLGCQILILRVRGPEWYLGISSKAAGAFNSKKEYFYLYALFGLSLRDFQEKHHNLHTEKKYI